jgi:hypothetical protein
MYTDLIDAQKMIVGKIADFSKKKGHSVNGIYLQYHVSRP